MRRILYLLLIIFLALPLFAVESETVYLEAIVPEDYSVVVPEAVAIDRLIFEIELESGEDELLSELPPCGLLSLPGHLGCSSSLIPFPVSRRPVPFSRHPARLRR